MHEHQEIPEGLIDEELSPEAIQEAEQLSAEYRRFAAGQRIGKVLRPKPLEEIVEEFRETLSWLQVEDIEAANKKNLKSTGEISIDYSTYDVEDTFFIVYSHLKGRRGVRVEDIINEHRETNLREWQERQTKNAASFLIIHGADENQVNQWKGVEGTARQQRALRRMFWLLSEPYMQQFKEVLMKRATSKQVYSFNSLTRAVKDIIIEGQENNEHELLDASSLIPRRKEELEAERDWLSLACNVCEQVFDRDITDNVYQVKK